MKTEFTIDKAGLVGRESFILRTGIISLAFDCIVEEFEAYWVLDKRHTVGLIHYDYQQEALAMAKAQGVRIIKAATDD